MAWKLTFEGNMEKRRLFLIAIFLAASFIAYTQEKEYFEINAKDDAITITGFRGIEKSIQIPDEIGLIPVRAIGNGAFANNKLISVIIPESVLSIGHAAFEGNLLREVVLPDHIKSINQLTFADNHLKNIVIPNEVTFIMDGAFANNQIAEIIIPDSVIKIGNGAFENNPLVKIRIGANVELFEGFYPFEELFCLYYNENGMKAGTYIKADGMWKLLDES
jgi:hypothetical protein